MTMIKAPLPAWIDDTPQMREKLSQALVPETLCERARRVAGLPAQLNCRICARGPCHFKRFAMPQDVPNRIKGATINQDGDAT